MARPLKYSEEQRAAALAALHANGGNAAKTARQTGIPRKTLTEWILESDRGTRTEEVADGNRHGKTPVSRVEYQRQAGELDKKLEELAHRIVDLMPDKIDGASLQQLAVTLGITIEKMRLLREQSTSNVNSSHRVEYERLKQLGYDELLQLHRQTLSAQAASNN